MKQFIFVSLCLLSTTVFAQYQANRCETDRNGVTRCSDGQVGQTDRTGQTVWNNGVVATPQRGGQTSYSNGMSSQTFGNQTSFSNGQTCVNNNGMITCR